MATVTLPDGSRVRASSLADRCVDDPQRAYGLYLDERWAPTWPADVIAWPDFGLPAEPEVAAGRIAAAFRRARRGELVEVGCLGGSGRTGTVLACMAVLAGVPPAEAVPWVRTAYRPEAVETAEQEAWVQWFAGWAAATIEDPRQPAPHGGDRMNDNPKLQVARLEEIERRGRSIPVREHLGIHAFGVNAFTPGEDGTLISDHDESGTGQEELYVVLDGNATFEIDGETFEAPAGTLVSVPPGIRRKATGEGTVLALGGTPGEAYQALDWGEAWPFQSESMTAYREQRYADAFDAVRRGLEKVPDHPGLHYNYACFATLAGETGDETFEHLRRSVELFPLFREQARSDEDLTAVRDDPRFEEALR